jgi:hypothetical protein
LLFPQPFSRGDRRRQHHPRVSSVEERASQGWQPSQLARWANRDRWGRCGRARGRIRRGRSEGGLRSLDELLGWLSSSDGLIHRVAFHFVGPDPRIALRNRSDLDEDEVREIRSRLARFDRASRDGPWTVSVLEVIRDRPGVRAPDLAGELRARDQAVQAGCPQAKGARPDREPRVPPLSAGEGILGRTGGMIFATFLPDLPRVELCSLVRAYDGGSQNQAIETALNRTNENKRADMSDLSIEPRVNRPSLMLAGGRCMPPPTRRRLLR